jgi:hypothetical protein
MTEACEEYSVCVSEEMPIHKGLEFIKQVNPGLFWSDRVIDQAVSVCCEIIETMSLRSVWEAGLSSRWNEWMQRFRDEQIDIAEQLQDRKSTIAVSGSMLTIVNRVVQNGVTWSVVACPEQDGVLRLSRRNRLTPVFVDSVFRVVLRSRRK